MKKNWIILLIFTLMLSCTQNNNGNDETLKSDAFKNKVSGIVIGRSLIKGNIKNNVQRLIDHLNK